MACEYHVKWQPWRWWSTIRNLEQLVISILRLTLSLVINSIVVSVIAGILAIALGKKFLSAHSVTGAMY